MPHRALAITSRHHPIAIGVYLSLAALGLLYVLDVATARSMSDETSGIWGAVWQYNLLAGGLLAAGGAFAPVKHLLGGLATESLGACILGLEVTLYVAVIIARVDVVPWASVLSLGAIGMGCLCRGYTAARDRRRVIRSALAQVPAVALAESPDA